MHSFNINFFKIRKILLFFIIIFLGIEITLRSLGLTDFPLYDTDNVIGYIPKPSQSGAFLGKNYWRFNSLSMKNDEEFNQIKSLDTLLVGDSIVYGGITNPINPKRGI